MHENLRFAVVIPALDEEASIGRVLADIPDVAEEVVVVDNGSTDATAHVARQHGARVVTEPRRGYGAACLAGIAALGHHVDVVVFLDADYSDRPEEMLSLLEPIRRGVADLVVGSRVRGLAAPGSLTMPQRFGNALACVLLRLFFGVTYTDLGPFRAIRHRALMRLGMRDRNYGWTVQMQARAARLGLRSAEVPVSYRRRVGRSKISGTVRGVVGAGTKILSTIFSEALRGRRAPRASAERLIILSREPRPGHTKTRLIPLLGPEGAAHLAAELLRGTFHTARELARRRGTCIEARIAGLDTSGPTRRLARGLALRDQGAGDLGERMRRAAAQALAGPFDRVVLIGSDCPHLAPDHIADAFDALDGADLALGPATDGGYYLIGVRADHAELFAGIPWGTGDVLMRTMEKARALGLRVKLLPTLSDLDRPADLGTWAESGRPHAGRRPWLSVVIPTLDEAEHLAATLASVRGEDGVQVIVADGGSTDRTVEIARLFGAEILVAPPSRGGQLNAGAARARGEVLLFLHADTRLPSQYGELIRVTLGRHGTAAGAFDLAIDASGPGLRLIEAGVRLRSRVLGRPYGDQAMFLPAETFHAVGGFPDMPFMEDYVMLSRLRPLGRIRIASASVRTAARSWRRCGIVRTTLHHQRLIILHHLGLSSRSVASKGPLKASAPRPLPGDLRPSASAQTHELHDGNLAQTS